MGKNGFIATSFIVLTFSSICDASFDPNIRKLIVSEPSTNPTSVQVSTVGSPVAGNNESNPSSVSLGNEHDELEVSGKDGNSLGVGSQGLKKNESDVSDNTGPASPPGGDKKDDTDDQGKESEDDRSKSPLHGDPKGGTDAKGTEQVDDRSKNPLPGDMKGNKYDEVKEKVDDMSKSKSSGDVKGAKDDEVKEKVDDTSTSQSPGDVKGDKDDEVKEKVDGTSKSPSAGVVVDGGKDDVGKEKANDTSKSIPHGDMKGDKDDRGNEKVDNTPKSPSRSALNGDRDDKGKEKVDDKSKSSSAGDMNGDKDDKEKEKEDDKSKSSSGGDMTGDKDDKGVDKVENTETQLSGNDNCKGSWTSCRDKALLACIESSKNGSPKLVLMVHNVGEKNLKVNVNYPDSLVTALPAFGVPQHETRRIDISTPGKSLKLILSSEEGTCALQLDAPVSVENILKQLSLYSKQVTPIYGAYMFFLLTLLSGGIWACCMFRKRNRKDEIPYQELEMSLPESTSAVHVEAVGSWDQDWDDDWDEENAVRSPGGHAIRNISANGLTSRVAKKDGWEDWDD